MASSAPTCSAIVKFGGAALTDKRQLEQLNHDGFASCIRLASQLPPRSCIVHGAGSFGHFHASLHNVNAGIEVEPKRHTDIVAKSSGDPGMSEAPRIVAAHKQHPPGWGMCETRRSVLKLNSKIFSALLDAGRCATALHPMDGWFSNDAVLCSAQLDCVERCLQLDVVPVLHGDVVFDSVRGFSILSGDDITQELSRHFRPPFVVFVSDVPGVFLHPPSNVSGCSTSDATFITLCTVDSAGNIKQLHCPALHSHSHHMQSLEVGGSSGTDITGGVPCPIASLLV
jgi:isopentenyl phosphate kinase